MSSILDLFKKIEAERSEIEQAPITHVIVGLGNPGEQYAFTRHNAGFLTLDYIAQKLEVKINRAKYDALFCEARLGGARVLLVKPQTYMNASGRAVRQIVDFYKIPLENLIVISDDTALAVGRMRVRKSGSDGGQRGLRDIIYQLGSDAFPRLRIGVGEKPNPNYDMADWVLSRFTSDEQKIIFEGFDRAMAGIEKIIAGDIDGAMALCNAAKKVTD